jgi:hypothetical protein
MTSPPGLSGLAYFRQGWVLGSKGFSATDTIAILAGNIPMLAWIIWLVVVARRTKESVRAPTRSNHRSVVLLDIDLHRIEAIMTAQDSGSHPQPGGLHPQRR